MPRQRNTQQVLETAEAGVLGANEAKKRLLCLMFWELILGVQEPDFFVV